MKKIFESPLNGWDEAAERIYVYALENDNELWAFANMTHDERCEYFNVFDQSDYEVMPGAMYHTYEFKHTCNHVMMIETVACNV